MCDYHAWCCKVLCVVCMVTLHGASCGIVHGVVSGCVIIAGLVVLLGSIEGWLGCMKWCGIEC